MKNLLDRLGRMLKRLWRRVFRRGEVSVPLEGAFLQRAVQDGVLRRSFRLYIPHGVGPEPVPLLVMLHGCRQSPESFALGTRMNDVADALGFMVLYPAQSRLANPLGCWNWFLRANQGRGGEPAAIMKMVDTVSAEWAVDAGSIFVAGLSAGGAMASTLGRAYPERFAGVGIHSALPGNAAKDVPGAYAAMGKGAKPPLDMPPVPTILFHGDADETVTSLNAERMIEAVLEANADAQTVAVEGAGWTQRIISTPDQAVVLEAWVVNGLGHAWSGGDPEGGYANASGPDASRELMRFFLSAAPVSAVQPEAG